MDINFASKRVRGLALVVLGLVAKLVEGYAVYHGLGAFPAVPVPGLEAMPLADAMAVVGAGWIFVGEGHALARNFRAGGSE